MFIINELSIAMIKLRNYVCRKYNHHIYFYDQMHTD